MPRYFFDLINDERIRDADGVELANADTARLQAIRAAGECIADEPDLLDGGDFRVELRNEDGLVLLTITIFATDAAVTFNP